MITNYAILTAMEYTPSPIPPSAKPRDSISDEEWRAALASHPLMPDTASRRAAHEANMRERARRLRAAKATAAIALEQRRAGSSETDSSVE